MDFSSSLASLARVMGLAPHEAIALPCVVEVSAGKVGMAQGALVSECFANAALRDYLAQACRNSMAQVAA